MHPHRMGLGGKGQEDPLRRAEGDAIDVDDLSVTNTDDDAAGITVTPTAGLGTTEAGGTATFEVVLAPDGSYAFVRQFGTTDVVIVDLDAKSVDTVEIGDNPTDLDISPDGRTAAVVALPDATLGQRPVAYVTLTGGAIDLAALKGQIASLVTYDLARLQHLRTPSPLLLTLNDGGRVAPGRVLERMTFAHPAFTHDSIAWQARHAEVSGSHRVHFCGAYWRNGFHEDGLVSGDAVADLILGSRA